jgi:phosphoribosylformylglycinamidine cyclo-ligase
LDYIAVNSLDPGQIAEFVKGISAGCQLADCALLGGETAEMPDLYRKGEFDLAGFAVGVVENRRLITGQTVQPGDDIVGLASDGLHSNGFALVRRICFDMHKLKPGQQIPELGETLGMALLRPTRIYVKTIVALLKKYRVKRVVRAMAHITGGGLVGNIPRVLPSNCNAVLRKKSWPVPAIFPYLQKLGPVKHSEMLRTFNMGIGFTLVTNPFFTKAIMARLEKRGEKPYLIGKVTKGTQKVIIK